MCDRSTEGGEPQLQECAEYLGDASLRLLRAMIHSRDLVGWGILASDDVRSARDRFSGCSRQIDPLHQGLAALLALGIAVGQVGCDVARQKRKLPRFLHYVARTRAVWGKRVSVR